MSESYLKKFSSEQLKQIHNCLGGKLEKLNNDPYEKSAVIKQKIPGVKDSRLTIQFNFDEARMFVFRDSNGQVREGETKVMFSQITNVEYREVPGKGIGVIFYKNDQVANECLLICSNGDISVMS